MYSPSRHRRSIWWDVAAVVFVLALFLVPAGFLVAEFMGGGGLGSGGGVVASSGGPAVAPSQPGFSAGRARQSAPPQALQLGGGSVVGGAETSSPSSSVPFSSSWRERATPSLLGQAEAPGANRSFSGGVGTARGRAEPFGSDGRSPGGTSRSEGSIGRSSGNGSRAAWTAEAHRFAGRAQALTNQLGQMDRATTSEQRASSGAKTSASRRAGSRTSADNPGLPGQPTVPIDDHLHWLLVAGVLWGAWRLHRG